MNPELATRFNALKERVESFPRAHGYYLIDLVELASVVPPSADEEEAAERVFRHFDDHSWPAEEDCPKGQSWADYEVGREEARRHTAEALAGGMAVGHLAETIPRETAEGLFDEFEAFFDLPRRDYVRMGLGDPAYVFQQGVVILTPRLVGILWVVEDD